jgi:hypothetical protein
MQLTPALAKGGALSLAVWADSRTSPPNSGLETQMGSDVLATRLDAQGNPIDSIPIVIRQDFGFQRNPKVAFNGESWLVVWENQSPTLSYYSIELQAARVSLDGELLDETPISVYTAEWSNNVYFDLTAVGNSWVVVATGTSAGETDIVASRIDADGKILNAKPSVLVPATFYIYFDLGVESAAGELLVTWKADGPVGRRFSWSLAPLSAQFSLPGTELRSSGESYLCVWYAGGVRASVISTSGVVQSPAGVAVAPAPDFAGGSLRTAWDGAQWWVGYASVVAGIHVAALSKAGVLLPGSVKALTTAPAASLGKFELAGAGAGAVAGVWEAPTVTPYDTSILGAITGLQGTPSAPVAISLGAAAQLDPDVAVAPFQRLVTWTEKSGEFCRVMARRFSLLGAPLDAAPRVLHTGTGLCGSTRAAWDGARFMVVWVNNNQAWMTRLSRQGELLDPAPVYLTNSYTVDVAGGSGRFYLVSSFYVTVPQQVFVFGRAYHGATGQAVDGSAVSLAGTVALFPRVERWGDRFVATWQSHFSFNGTQSTSAFSIISHAGEVLYSSGTNFGGQVTFAPGKETGLVVWRSGSQGNINNDIHAVAIDFDGNEVAPHQVLSAAINRQLWPTATWTGSEFWVAWEDQRDASAFFDDRTAIYGARVAADGTLLDGAAVPLALGATPSIQPVLFSQFGFVSLIAAHYVADEPYATYVLGLTHIGQAPLPLDMNLDGSINAADFVQAKPCFGMPGTLTPLCSLADYNGDGALNRVDWAAFVAALNKP